MSLFGLLTSAWVTPNNPITKKSLPGMDDDFPVDTERAFPLQLMSYTLHRPSPPKTVSNWGRIAYSWEEVCRREWLESQERVMILSTLSLDDRMPIGSILREPCRESQPL